MVAPSKDTTNYPIGYLVWWDTTSEQIDREQFVQVMQEAKLDLTGPDLSLKDTKIDTRIVLKIVKEINRDKTKQLTIKKIAKKKGIYTFHMLEGYRSSVDEDSALLTFSPTELACDHSHRAFDIIKAKYDKVKNPVSPSMIDSVLVDLLDKCHKITISEKKGIHFIPETHEDETLKLETFVRSLATSINFTKIDVFNSFAIEEMLYGAFMFPIAKKIKEIKVACLPSDKVAKSDSELKLMLKEVRKELAKVRDLPPFLKNDDLKTSFATMEMQIKDLKKKIEVAILGEDTD